MKLPPRLHQSLVAQWTERRSTEAAMQVRFLPGGLLGLGLRKNPVAAHPHTRPMAATGQARSSSNDRANSETVDPGSNPGECTGGACARVPIKGQGALRVYTRPCQSSRRWGVDGGMKWTRSQARVFRPPSAHLRLCSPIHPGCNGGCDASGDAP